MSEIRKCDRCGVQEEVEPDHVFPDGWENVDESDLCRVCYEEFREFMQAKKKR